MLNSLLKETRENKGLTQLDVASRAQISLRAYQNYEADLRVPNAYVAMLIAEALSTSVDKLYSIPRRQPGDTIAQGNFNTVSNHAIAAAELSEVPPSELVRAAVDLQDGRADTPAGARVLELMRQTGGAALA